MCDSHQKFDAANLDRRGEDMGWRADEIVGWASRFGHLIRRTYLFRSSICSTF